MTALGATASAQPVPDPAPPADAPPAEPAPEPAPAAPVAPAEPPPPAPAAPAVTTGTIVGRVLTTSGDAIGGALVKRDGSSSIALVGADGTFSLTAPAGQSTLVVESGGFVTTRQTLQLAAGGTATVEIRLAASDLIGEEIVVIGSRLAEKRLDAPVTVEVVTEQSLRTATGASYLSALSRVKGIDFADAGFADTRISARGFATQFNSRLLFMVDGRLAQLPGLGLPQGNLLPIGGLDMKSIEVVVGPASAMYGANAHTGVVNVSTKTPWDESGAAVAVKSGTQRMGGFATRLAGTVRDRFGWKVNAESMAAKDFRPERGAGTHDFNTEIFEGDLVGNDYSASLRKGDATVYWKQGEWLASVGGGLSETTGFQLTNTGRSHIRDWQVQHQVAQLSGPHVYAQVTRSASDAGRTYQIDRLAQVVAASGGLPGSASELEAMRSGVIVTDDSSMIDAELQGNYKLYGVRATAGGQIRRFMPDSNGTILDDRDRAIEITEAGAYVQLDTLLFEKLRLAGAARVDSHSEFDTQVSPKVAVQYEVFPSHNVRVGYNRAFKSPTILENYLRINEVLRGNRTGFAIEDADGNVLAEIDPLRPERVDAIELGYKGAFGDKVYVDAVAYYSWYRDFISPLSALASPAAAMPTFGTFPDGTRVAAGTPAEGTLFSYVNFGNAKVRGADVGVDFRPIPRVTLSGSVSVLDLVSFKNDNDLQRDLVLNAPSFKARGSVLVEDLPTKNVFARVDGRFHDAYAFESGYWNSQTLLGGDIPSRFVLDATVGLRVPSSNLTFTGTIANALNDREPDVLGGPAIGRFAWIQVAYKFDGLRY